MKTLDDHIRWLGLYGAWHIVYYIPRGRVDETIYSKKILDFKDGEQGAIDSWAKWSASELDSTGIRFDVIVRALGSQELKCQNNKPLDQLGSHLAHCLKTDYIPAILEKKFATPPLHTLRTIPQRKEAIEGAYYVADASHKLKRSNILIIDDVTTTNVTLAEILRALRVEWPLARYYFFCLGKTNYQVDINKQIKSKYF